MATSYKSILLNNVKQAITVCEKKGDVSSQGHAMLLRDTRELLNSLNEMQACKVFREIEKASMPTPTSIKYGWDTPKVEPCNYSAFVKDVLSIEMPESKAIQDFAAFMESQY